MKLDTDMVLIPPVFNPPPIPPKDKNKRKKTVRSPLSNRRLSPESRKENRNTIKKSLSTVQGVSTLKVVLMYSVLGLILNWVLPTLILGVRPQIPKDQADLWGTTIAMVITGVLLVVALLKDIILRKPSKPHDKNHTTPDRKENG